MSARVLRISFLALMVAACSSSSPQTPADAGTSTDGGSPAVDAGPHADAGQSSGGLTVAEFQTQLPQAICANEQKCQHDDLLDPSFCVDDGHWLDTDSAFTSSTTFDTSAAAIASVSRGEATLDGVQAQKCLDAIRNLPCDSPYDGLEYIQECVDAFSGKLKLNDACISSLACGEGLICIPKNFQGDVCMATCQTAGERCLTDDDCDTGKICDATSHDCVAPSPAPGGMGQPCGAHNLCEDPLGCFNDSGKSVCKSLGGDGSPCTVDGSCADGLVCLSDATGKQLCKTPPAPAAEGAACDQQLEAGACANGEACITNDDASDTFCQPLKKLGESCTHLFQCGGDNSESICDPTAHKCVARPKTGPCPAGVDGTCDPKSFCDTSQNTPACTPLFADAAACTDDSECQSGSCDSSAHQCAPTMQIAVCMP